MNGGRLNLWLSQKFLSLMTRMESCLPFKWRLSFLARAYILMGWEPEVKWLKAIGPCRGMAVDAGANKGFYSLALSKIYSKIVAFEPNRSVAAPLIAASLPGVEIIHVGLSSSESATATLYVPISNGVSLPGWGSLDEHNCPGSTGVDAQEIQLRTLDSFRFENVGFIKIDVEGHELEVMRGASETIQRDRPHLLVEVRDQNLTEVRGLLSGWGYFETSLQALGGPEGSPENYLFLPQDLHL